MHARPSHWIFRGMAILLVSALIAACQGAPDDSAQKMLPSAAGYTLTESTNLLDSLSKMAAGAAAAGGQLQISGIVLAGNELAKCYQEAGAVRGRLYVNPGDPTDAGFVVIANRNVLLNPATLIGCLTPKTDPGLAGAQVAFQPCVHAYSLPKDNNEFYIFYAATNPGLCQKFCSGLEGCTAVY